MSQKVYLETYNGTKSVVLLSPLLRKIQKACRQTLREPDLAASLDIADFINEKQGPNARDACITLVQLVNSRDTHTAVLAVSILNVLVRNCGYPVHLQVSRKEFLNQLVRRFPEHPSPHYSQLQRLILHAIEEWYQTFAKHGEYKREMSYIRDMHRLLSYKGYAFPKLDQKDLAVLQPKKELKTVRDIQKEQDIKQAAKLEELIRRGSPQDLLEANRLMKIMAGFKQDNVVYAKQVVNHELNKLKHKADIFDEMLSQTKSVSSDKDDTVNVLYATLKSAYPKFQQLLEEEEDDDKLVQNLTSFKYYVSQLLEEYKLIKAGKLTDNSSSRVDKMMVKGISSQTETYQSAENLEVNLLDFDSEPSPVPSLVPLTSTGDTTPMSESLSYDDTIKSGDANIDLIDLLGDFSKVAISNEPKSVQQFEQICNTQEGSAAVATIGLSVDDIQGVPLNNSSDLLSDILNADEETASSSVSSTSPEPTPFSEKYVLVHETADLSLHFALSKPTETSIQLAALFSNLSDQHIRDMKFSLAAPKTLPLQMQPQSTETIPPNTKDGMKQVATISNVTPAYNRPLRVKWKLQYTKEVDNVACEDGAVYTLPSFS